MDMKPDDSALAMRAGEGDAIAFRMLLERHYDGIFRTAYRLCGKREDAEDIAQDVCTGLVDRIGQFRGEAKFTTWLHRIVVNASRDHFRRQSRVRRLDDDYVEILTGQGDADAETRSNIAWLYQSLKQVGSDLRETAVLVLAMGYSHGEAAEIMSVKESTVSWRMHELRKKLKAKAEYENE